MQISNSHNDNPLLHEMDQLFNDDVRLIVMVYSHQVTWSTFWGGVWHVGQFFEYNMLVLKYSTAQRRSARTCDEANRLRRP